MIYRGCEHPTFFYNYLGFAFLLLKHKCNHVISKVICNFADKVRNSFYRYDK